MINLLANPIFQSVASGLLVDGLTSLASYANRSNVESDFQSLILKVCDDLSESYPVPSNEKNTFWDCIADEINANLIFTLDSPKGINEIIKSKIEDKDIDYSISEITETFKEIFLRQLVEYDALYKYANILYQENILNTLTSKIDSLKDIIKHDSMSEMEIIDIEKDIQKYVINNSYYIASKLLEEEDYVLILGNPGTGKTTLARILIYDYILKGYELVAISKDIEKAVNLFNEDKKQLFYYNDFLGSNLLEDRFVKNEEKRLESFIKLVHKSSNKKIILTSRTYLLNQAKSRYENFLGDKYTKGKYIVETGYYTKDIKAKILYKHLVASNTPKKFVDILLKDNNVLNIIKHPNYSPRIIDWMTDNDKISILEEQNYYNDFMKFLDNPKSLWEHAFENHITEFSRYYLYVLFSFNISLKLSIQNEAFINFIKLVDPSLNIILIEDKICKIIDELENSFITIYGDSKNDFYINFQNPSIKDYIYCKLQNSKTIIQYIVKSAIYFDQLSMFFEDKNNKKKNDENRGIKTDTKIMNMIQEILVYKSGLEGSPNFNQTFFDARDYKANVLNFDLNELTRHLNSNVIFQIHDNFDLSNRPKIRNVLKFMLEKCYINEAYIDFESALILIEELSNYEMLEVDVLLDKLLNAMNKPSDIFQFIRMNDIYPNEFTYYYKRFSDQIDTIFSNIIETDACEIEYDGGVKAAIETLEIIKSIELCFGLKYENPKERILGALIYFGIDYYSEANNYKNYSDIKIEKALINAIVLSSLWGPASSTMSILNQYQEILKSSITKNQKDELKRLMKENIRNRFDDSFIGYDEDDLNEYGDMLDNLSKIINIDFKNEKRRIEALHKAYKKKELSPAISKNRTYTTTLFEDDISDNEIINMYIFDE